VHLSKSRYIVAAGVTATVLAVGACSSNSSTSSGSSVATNSPATSSSAAAGASSGSTIQIGFANMDTGTTSFPGILTDAQAAEQYVNAHGGVAGHKIQLVSCDMKNDAQSAQECGQEFANNPNIPFAIVGLTLNGGPFYQAMAAAHKPTLGMIGITPADNAPPDTYFYYSGSNYYPSLVSYLNGVGIKSLAYVYEGEASSEAGEKYVTSHLSPSIKVTTTQVPANAADVTSQVAASGAHSADLMMAFTVDCSRVATALQSLSLTPKKVIGDPGCLNLATISQDPAIYQDWYFVENYKVSSITGSTDPDVTLFNQERSSYGAGGTVGAFGEMGWGMILTLANVFKGASDVTSSSALTAISGFKGPVVMGASKISCPGAAPYMSTCASGLYLYQVRGGKIYDDGEIGS
jgi:branched-chain amino acid transport system substrate-binding protein